MTRFGSVALVVLATALAPRGGEAQFVLRDDTAGWGWLGMTPDVRAVVSLGYGAFGSDERGRLDLRVLNDLAALGIGRLGGSETFEPMESQVLAECAAVSLTPAGADLPVYGLHTEVSYWDHNRLSATEIYEAMTVGQIPPTDLATDTYVDHCVSELARILPRLGFRQG
jgi:hypothetical protein